MKYYDQNVMIVMDFLRSRNYGTTSICQHKRCYKLLKTYLEQRNLPFSNQSANTWYLRFRDSLSPESNSYKSVGLALKRLQDVYEVGRVRDIHITLSKPFYQLLDTRLKLELDDFVTFKKSQGYPDSYINVMRFTGARFMYFLQNRKNRSIEECRYKHIFEYYNRNNQKDNAHKNRCDCIASEILEYYSKDSQKLFGMSLVLSKPFIDQIVRDFSFLNGNSDDLDLIPIDNLWETIERFLLKMKLARYSITVLKVSKHTLVLLYIFRDMYDQPLNEATIWQWFDVASDKFGTGWKQSRRSLSQFLLFTKIGKLVTSITGRPYKDLDIDKLPVSLKSPLKDFLLLKKRLRMTNSTCDMYRSSVVRLARFMCTKYMESYSDITPDFLVQFNNLDYHTTPEGKQAYNSRIRGFLTHLIEEGIIENPHLAKALPTVVSKRIKIPSVLTNAEISALIAYHVPLDNASLLKSHAMVMLGLFTGLRASDVVALQFSNIDWSQQTLAITQQKTGKFIKLYLPVIAGNALYRYLKYGRPSSELPYIFLSHRAPYNNLHRSACAKALHHFLPKRAGTNEGFHILRKTFATNMLQSKNNVFIIAEALGHRGNDTIGDYLGMNIDSMRRCPLSLDSTGSKWIGGDFFV